MFKNIIIAILFIALLAFSYIAIKNSKPVECDDLMRTSKDNMICIIELGDVQEDEIHEVLQQRYERQPLFYE